MGSKATKKQRKKEAAKGMAQAKAIREANAILITEYQTWTKRALAYEIVKGMSVDLMLHEAERIKRMHRTIDYVEVAMGINTSN